MIVDNRTKWDSVSLRRLIQAACTHDGFVVPVGAKVVVVTSRGRYSGWASYFARPVLNFNSSAGAEKCYRGAAMLLRLPARDLNMPKLAHLVRHEVAHWRGLKHRDFGRSLLEWPSLDAPVPEWAAGIVVDQPPSSALGRQFGWSDRVAVREKRARSLLAEHEAKLAREKKLVAKWAAKVRYYDREKEKRDRREFAALHTPRHYTDEELVAAATKETTR